MVHYFYMFKEIDLIDRGVNPLITWADELAEYIVKAVAGNHTNFRDLFLKHSRNDRYLSQNEFLSAMEDIAIDAKFSKEIIKKFYYFIDEDKNQKVDFKELESIVKTHCPKTTVKLASDIIDQIKGQMERNNLKVRDVYRTLDLYSKNEMISKRSFKRAIYVELRIRLEEIDLDFLASYYMQIRDKRYPNGIRYSQFMDDLKQKFELTETYVVPGKLRRMPSHTYDDILNESFGKKEASRKVSIQERDNKIRLVLRKLKDLAHKRRVNLKDEFRIRSERRNGILSETQFRRLLGYYNFDLDKNEVNLIVDRFIDTVGNKIDTNLIIDFMYEDTEQVPTRPEQEYKDIVDTPILAKLARKAERERVSDKLIYNLERKDIDDTKYLPFEFIKEAFHISGLRISTRQAKDMLREIRKNIRDEYNYHILLTSMFGKEYHHRRVIPGTEERFYDEEALYDSDGRPVQKRTRFGPYEEKKSRSRTKSRRGRSKSSRSRGPYDPPVDFPTKSILKKPKGHQAKVVGKRLEHSKYNYIGYLKTISGDDKDFILTEPQVYKMLENARIRLTDDEKFDFIKDMEESRFTIEDFFIKCGLPLGDFEKEEYFDTKIKLNKEEKEEAQKLLVKIGLAIVETNKEYELVFNIGHLDTKIDFAEFAYGIEHEIDEE